MAEAVYRFARFLRLPGLVLLILVLAACNRSPEALTLEGQTMGTYWMVRLGSAPDDLASDALQTQIEALLEQVNDEMSTYRPDALISRFNRGQGGTAFDLPPGFSRVVKEALYWAEQTDGAFDPTAGPLVNLWGFGPAGSEQAIPSAERIEQVKTVVGWTRLIYDANDSRLIQPGGLYLDLSGIAKGWGVDVVAEHLLSTGIKDFLVDIGGELRVSGTRPDGEGWRVGIERPATDRREVVSVVEVSDLAIATSGNYRNFFEADGQHFSHLIDPRSGRPISHSTVSVTVATATATAADALATALSVMSIDEGWRFASERGLAVFWLLAEEQKLAERMTPAFEQLLDTGEI
ncbi:MAG: FAD:protein FMN transferase [Wenzhouxiangella sp.]